MKFVYSGIDTVFSIEETYANELVIENKRLFREVVEDLSAQVSGFSGKALLSIDNVSVDTQKHIEVITCFVPFEMIQGVKGFCKYLYCFSFIPDSPVMLYSSITLSNGNYPAFTIFAAVPIITASYGRNTFPSLSSS